MIINKKICTENLYYMYLAGATKYARRAIYIFRLDINNHIFRYILDDGEWHIDDMWRNTNEWFKSRPHKEDYSYKKCDKNTFEKLTKRNFDKSTKLFFKLLA